MAKNITREDFCKVYVPAANSGKSALEIARELGLEGDDKKASQYVTVRASQMRAELKQEAEKMASQKELDESETAELVHKLVSLVPKLKRRTTGERKSTKEFVDMLENLVAECDS